MLATRAAPSSISPPLLENEAGASVRSLWVERERGQFAPPELQPGPCVTAHPVAVALALLLLRAKKAGAIRRAVATVFEPASEHGQRGMDELHQQTVNLLSFQPLPKDVFDAQVAFNMVARYGQKSQPALDSVEARILRHYQKIAGDDAPRPSLHAAAGAHLSRPCAGGFPGDGECRRRAGLVASPGRAITLRFRARRKILRAT